jgi:hypothetical protein
VVLRIVVPRRGGERECTRWKVLVVLSEVLSIAREALRDSGVRLTLGAENVDQWLRYDSGSCAITPKLSCGRDGGREDGARSGAEPERRLPLLPFSSRPSVAATR